MVKNLRRAVVLAVVVVVIWQNLDDLKRYLHIRRM
ncbi:DUF6893 family small protein [Kitasatospora sp. NPDC056184]